MTKETASELAKIFQAYSEGKQIQINKHSNDNEWDDINVISVDIYTKYLFEGIRLRIKPEPKYVPFTFEEAKKIKDKWVKLKGWTALKNIIAVFNTYVVIFDKDKYGEMDLMQVTFENLLNKYEFEDKTPCGKLIEE